ncbi:MAG: DUF2807 domain-containing protein [Flavobacteriaceae bacterium]|nr:DUF2807 domain-containing protein [Flavobacteriaceae bacterium]
MQKNYTKTSILILSFLLLFLGLNAQEKIKGNRNVTTEDRGISNFSKIEIKGKVDVIITQENSQSISVETDENIHEAIKTNVINDVLIIKLTKKIIRKKTLKIYIAIDEYIDEITSKDKTDIKGNGTFNFTDITINAQGDSKIKMNIKTEQFTLNNNESANVNLDVSTNIALINANKTGKGKINLSSDTVEVITHGSSSIELLGDCKNLIINAENKSNLKASKLECNEATVNASDNSNVYVNANEYIIISAINSSTVNIYNNPEIIIETFIDKAILKRKHQDNSFLKFKR